MFERYKMALQMLQNMDSRGQGAISVTFVIGIVLALVVGSIGLDIVDNVIASAGFSGLTSTVTGFVTVMFAVLLLTLPLAPFLS
jgi:hypothetical protein